jgi:uncharacterized repeat protein (TIGR03803 family)
MHRLNALVVAALVAAGSLPVAPAQTFETVYSLPDPGGQPLGALVKTVAGSFLGTATSGGSAELGTVFEVTPEGVVTRLVNFNGDNGMFPDGALTLGTDGKYYGVARAGGQSDRGVAFRVSATGEFEKLANFSTINAPRPTGRVIQGSDGNYYGLCSDGAQSPAFAGLIFKLTPARTLSVLAQFPANGLVGKSPADGLVEQDDSFLGVTTLGGSGDTGVLFKVTTAGALSKLADFTGANGSKPTGGLVKGSDGNYYGTTETGGAHPSASGTIFKVTPAGVFSTIASFDFANGYAPQGRLVESNGTFHGITKFGGANNEGTIFKITPGDAVPAITKLADLDSSVGTRAYAGLVFGNNDALYGTTSRSGAADFGTIIKVTTGGALTKVADLGAPLGQNLTGLVPGPNNLLYGTAATGGAGNVGTLLQMTTTGIVTKLADFDLNTVGGYPAPRIVVGSDQNLYGVTPTGEKLFKATTAGEIAVLASFGPLEIHSPNAIIEASDGAFYGTAYGTSFLGNTGDPGCIYRYSTEGGLVKLFQLTESTGKHPGGALVEGPDGALYGTTTLGGAFNKGTVFRITKSGIFKTLASFSGNNGAQPIGPLVLGRDGNLYGLTGRGGPNGTGTVFRVSPSGKLNRLASFNGFNGAYPSGGLVVGPGGNLYGVAYAGGGPSFFGTVFRVSLGGTLTVLQKFDGKTNGAYPTSTLCIGPDGNLYGTTSSTVFRLLTTNHAPVAKNDSFDLPVIQKNVIGNDTDSDKDPLNIISVTDGQHGTVEFTEDGTVTYLPNPDFDSDTVQTDSFTYTISDGLGGTSTATVTVSVPLNILRAGAGAYGGVLALNGSAQGYWALGMTGVGAFTGAIYVDGGKTPIKGVFALDGSFSQTVPRKAPLTPLVVNLQLDTIRNTITGTVSNGTDTFTVELIRNLPIFSSSRPTPRAGRYTVLLTPNQSGPLFPGGTGFARMTVTPKGAVAIVGKLGDGAPFAAGSFLTSTDEVPVYAQAYLKKKGYLTGLLAFENLAGSDVSGSLSWKKPEQLTDALYPAGFTTSTTLKGAGYTKASPVLPLSAATPNASLVLDGLGSKELSISTGNVVRVTAPAGDTTKVKIDSKSGIFTGTYPDGGTRRAFSGVIYQKGVQHGEGTFFGETSTGKISIVPVTVP